MEHSKVNYKKIYAKQNHYKNQLLATNPKLNDKPGIYFLLRTNEQGFKFAYIGQTRQGILSRMISHMNGYQQHIDLSLKRHKLYSNENPCGWRVEFINCPISELDDREKYYIKAYADAGYQLRNQSLGGQGENRSSGQLGERKQPKTYTQGKIEGKKQLARDLSHIIDTHLEVKIRDEKKHNKISINAYEKFKELIDERTYE